MEDRHEIDRLNPAIEPTTANPPSTQSVGAAPAASPGALLAAQNGANLVGEWDAAKGGWALRLRDPGARLAAAGFELATQALDPGVTSPLRRIDLAMDQDMQFTEERFFRLQHALVVAELSPPTDLMEALVLAFEVAFESGARRALADATSG
ncbi:MAG: hypothetical protein EKK62_00700 [Acidimicrobiia bacterium]|nr:MAG: hypothetical protein EKK62_00700 [Acidimicrobiia bacterium]